MDLTEKLAEGKGIKVWGPASEIGTAYKRIPLSGTSRLDVA